MKMDVNAECRRKPAAEAFSNGPLALSCPTGIMESYLSYD